MDLSDFFSEDFKANFANEKIDLGTTLIVEIPQFNITHKKFAIIIGFADEIVAMVIINSEINANVFRTEFLRSQHILISSKGHEDFLDHDSFIDCTKLQSKRKSEVIDYIKNNPRKVFNVSEETCRKINQMITTSKLIPIAEKKLFGFI